MKSNSLYVNINSEQPEKLIAFYRDVIGLPMNPDMGPGAFDAGGAIIGIDGHSEVHGSAKEPGRILIDLFVDDVVGERERLEAHGVTFIRKEGVEEWGGVISTFPDPDGNYVQLIRFNPPAVEATNG